MSRRSGPPPHHRTLTCYTDYGCRLRACMDRKRKYQRELRRKKKEGQPPLVDAQPVRDHVLQLQADGVSRYSIANAAGVDEWTVGALFSGPNRGRKNSVSPETARKILAVVADQTAPGCIDGTGTRRRIQAMAARGWPLRQTATRFDINPTYAGDLIRRGQGNHLVYAATAEKVARAYEELKNRHPSRYGVADHHIRQARERAKAKRWAPPKYWDQHPGAIDDPNFEPMYGVTRRMIVAQDANWIMRTGADRVTTAERLGVSKAYIDHAFRDHPEYAVGVAA